MTTIAMPARAVAAPVLERLRDGGRGTVLGTGDGIAWAGIGGFAVLVIAGGAPLLPNSVALAGGRAALARTSAGDPASYRPGLLQVGPIVAVWDPACPPVWEPRVVPVVGDPGRIRRRGEALLRALGAPLPPGGRGGRATGETPILIPLMALAGVVLATEAGSASALGTLMDAVSRQDVAAAAAAADALCGRGAGLTPEGDDLLAAVAAGMATLGPAVGVREPALTAWARALVPPDVASRTSELAWTLLRLAAGGRVLEPAGCLLDLTATGERRWPSALTRLLRARHASGRAYAAGIAATACALTASRRAGATRRVGERAGERRTAVTVERRSPIAGATAPVGDEGSAAAGTLGGTAGEIGDQIWPAWRREPRTRP